MSSVMMSWTSPVSQSWTTNGSVSSLIGIDRMIAVVSCPSASLTKTLAFSSKVGGRWIVSVLLLVLKIKAQSNCSLNWGPDGKNESRRYPSAHVKVCLDGGW